MADCLLRSTRRERLCADSPLSKSNTASRVLASALCGCNKRRLLPPLPVFSMRYWYMCSVNSMCELRRSSSSTSGLLVLRAVMAASRKRAAFSAVGARSSLWFWSCRGEGGGAEKKKNGVKAGKGDHKEAGKEDRCEKDAKKERTPREEGRQLIGPRLAIPAH